MQLLWLPGPRLALLPGPAWSDLSGAPRLRVPVLPPGGPHGCLGSRLCGLFLILVSCPRV